MITGIDHVVIWVNDLDAASVDYVNLGFTVVPGGEHTGGVTRNALVCFMDGSYLELIAANGELPESHFFYRQHGQEGLVTFALLPDDIEKDIARARKRGLELEGPTPGGRTRPDGKEVKWQTAKPPTHDLPFLCGDVTPRELRVPTGAARLHTNGIKGIGGILLAVEDIEASKKRYRALLGREPMVGPPDPDGPAVAFSLGDATIVVIQPTQGGMRDYLVARGEGPYGLIMRSGASSGPRNIDPDETHGVGMAIVPG
jgi:catechol 2,3-dioxygenase-like lactoylglutathione lyase family enzyme